MDRYGLLTVPEVAEQIRQRISTVYALIKARKLAAHRMGKHLRVSQSDLDLFVVKSRHAAHGTRKTKSVIPPGDKSVAA
jgi:excisionase family DNA binding protein